MTEYADNLAADQKALCTVWDFPDLETRFVTEGHAGLTLPGGWTQFDGARPIKDKGSAVALHDGKLEIGSAGFEIPDVDQALTHWFADHETDISRARVIRRQGFLGVAEAEYAISRWLLGNYSASGDAGGGFAIDLVNVFRPLQRGLYEDFDGESYRLSQSFQNGDTQLHLKDSPKGIWREPGHVVVYNEDDNVYELVGYTAIGGTGNKVLQTLTRRKFGVKAPSGYDFAQKEARVWQVWVKRGNPLDIMREWMATTDAGTNGDYDIGDGDGLGDELDDAYFDHNVIDDVRDQFWPVPVFTGDALTSGNAMLFVEKDPIVDVLDFVVENIIQPLGLILVVTAEERLGVATRYRTPVTPTAVGSQWMVKDFEASKWDRGLDGKKLNLLRVQTDWDIGKEEHAFSKLIEDALSQDQFGKSKVQELGGRGFRSGKLGFPDYHGISDASIGASRVLLDVSNPAIELEIDAFYKFKDLSMGEAVAIDVPGVPDLDQRRRGLIASPFLIYKRQVDDLKGKVLLGLRQRRLTFRPWIIAPNSVSDDYATASDADKAFCYFAPGDEDFFPDGSPAYKVVPG